MQIPFEDFEHSFPTNHKNIFKKLRVKTASSLLQYSNIQKCDRPDNGHRLSALNKCTNESRV